MRLTRSTTLGNGGTIVSTECPGTMTSGTEADEKGFGAILDAFAAAGGSLIDTADVESNGVSEEITAGGCGPTPTRTSSATLRTPVTGCRRTGTQTTSTSAKSTPACQPLVDLDELSS